MTTSDFEEVVLRITNLGTDISGWTSYTFNSTFLTPSDAFSFTIGDPSIPAGVAGQIREGMGVQLLIAGRAICTGYLDEVHYEASTSGGTVLTCSGRDVLGDAIDATVAPSLVFTPTQKLGDIIESVMLPFGFFNEPLVDNEDNRNLITGNKFGYRVNKGRSSKRGRRSKTAGQAVASFTNYQAKPHDHEGAYEFCERLAKRAGLHIWATGDGKDLVVGRPSFDQQALFSAKRLRGVANGAHNNVLSGSVTRSRKDQFSAIIAGGGGGGGNVSRATNQVIMINDLVARDVSGAIAPEAQALIRAYPKAYLIKPDDLDGQVTPGKLNAFRRAKPLHLFDAEARDPEQLKNFVIREMAHRQKTAISASYEFSGHGQNGVTWAVDTIVNVEDDVADLHEPMWIDSVSFSKSSGAGTRTHITCIIPWTLQI